MKQKTNDLEKIDQLESNGKVNTDIMVKLTLTYGNGITLMFNISQRDCDCNTFTIRII